MIALPSAIVYDVCISISDAWKNEKPKSSTHRKSGLLDLVGELIKTHMSVDKQVSHVMSQRMCMIKHGKIQDGIRDLCHLPEHHQ